MSFQTKHTSSYSSPAEHSYTNVSIAAGTYYGFGPFTYHGGESLNGGTGTAPSFVSKSDITFNTASGQYIGFGAFTYSGGVSISSTRFSSPTKH